MHRIGNLSRADYPPAHSATGFDRHDAAVPTAEDSGLLPLRRERAELWLANREVLGAVVEPDFGASDFGASSRSAAPGRASLVKHPDIEPSIHEGRRACKPAESRADHSDTYAVALAVPLAITRTH